MPKTLTVRLDDDTALKLEKLSEHFDQKTSSKTLKLLIDTYFALQASFDDLEKENNLLLIDLETRKKVIEGARSSAALLLELTAQGDLLERPQA